MTTAKRFSGAPTKRQRRMKDGEGRKKEGSLVADVHKMFNTIKRAAQRKWQKEREREVRSAEKDVKNVKYLTTWWTCQHTKPNEAWPTKTSEFQANSPSEVETRWLVNSGKLSAIQLRLSYTKCAATAIHPSIHPSSNQPSSQSSIERSWCTPTALQHDIIASRSSRRGRRQEREPEGGRERGTKTEAKENRNPNLSPSRSTSTRPEPSTIVTINHG